jgi:predicted glycoside hydrolase/deacetylase ChbG (UPF0249 family)
MNCIDIHADDFGISYNASQNIIDLCKTGLLDSISIIPNMTCFDKCSALYKDSVLLFPHKIKISVHLNFMEGHCCAPVFSVPDLVDSSGLFSASWLSLLLSSFNPFKRTRIRRQLACEISSQINKLLQSGICAEEIRIDSHQHPHHIPVVCDALADVVNSGKFNIRFIRNSREPVSAYFKHFNLFSSFGSANIIKCALLNTFSVHLLHAVKKQHLADGYLCGVFMSGCMNDRLRIIEHSLVSFAEKKHAVVEVLFHPGTVLPEEITEEYCKPGFVSFHLSPNRIIENRTIRSLYKEFHSME